MRKIGSVYLIEMDEERFGSLESPDIDPELNNKVLIELRTIPNPETVWPPSDVKERSGRGPYPERLCPSNNEMIAYIRDKNKKLLELGILTEDVMTALADHTGHVRIASEFVDEETAWAIFDKARNAQIADIYLYRNGKLWAKYD